MSARHTYTSEQHSVDSLCVYMYIYCICLCKIIISKEKVKNLRGGRAWEELDGVKGLEMM